MRQALLALAFVALGASSAPAQGNKVPTKKQPPAATNKTAQTQVYLGVGVEALPAALAGHLSNVVPKGEGVLVEQVAMNSPAEKSGLQANDILLSFDGKKLHSPQELVKLVRADKPGQQVTVGYVRNGKSATSKVTLAEHAMPNPADQAHVYRFRPDERLREMFEQYEVKNGKTIWDAFESMKLSRVDAKHWRAEIDYRAKDGKKEHKSFEGTREEIRKSIRAENDLPLNERHHLLRALHMHEPVFEFHFPSFPSLNGIAPDYEQP